MGAKAENPPPPRSAGASRNGFTRAEYIAFLEQEKTRRGQEWYDRKMGEMKAKDKLRASKRKQSRDAAWDLWWQQINAWSGAGGFHEVMDVLLAPHGPGKKVGGARLQWLVGNTKFEVHTGNRTCCRWDGNTFSNGKKGAREAYGLAKCYFELSGSANAGREARDLLCKLSGMNPEPVEITADVEKRLLEIRQAAAESARRRAEEDLREDPISPATAEEAPLPITDPKRLRHLTGLVARERGFSLEYAQRLVAEKLIRFGTFRYRDERTGTVVDTGRPIAVSEVHGFRTGTLVGYSSREFRAFFPKKEGKGKNLGRITKGAVFIGQWGPATKKVTVIEGVYDAAALRWMREQQGHPLAQDECFAIVAGTRLPDQLLQQCKERDIELVLAVDNDLAGHELCEHARVECEAKGIRFSIRLPTKGEFTLRLKADERGREQYVALADALRASACKHLLGPEADGWLSLVVETSPASLAIFKQLRLDEQATRLQGDKDLDVDRRLKVEWHRKDWNELLQREYTCRANTCVGLPAPAPELEDEHRAHVTTLTGDVARADEFRECALTYPTIYDGQPFVAWVGVDLGSGVVRSFRLDGLRGDAKQMVICGAHWVAGFSIGNPDTCSLLAVSDSPAEVLKTTSPGTLTVLPFGVLPAQVLALARERNMALVPVLHPTISSADREAELAEIARANGLRFRAAAEQRYPDDKIEDPQSLADTASKLNEVVALVASQVVGMEP